MREMARENIWHLIHIIKITFNTKKCRITSVLAENQQYTQIMCRKGANHARQGASFQLQHPNNRMCCYRPSFYPFLPLSHSQWQYIPIELSTMYSATHRIIQIHIYLNYIPLDVHHTDTTVILLTHLLAAKARHVQVGISLPLPKGH